MAPVRIAALAANPSMYQSQLYRLIASDPRVDLRVIFASSAGVRPYRYPTFGDQLVQWDTDLLSGYEHSFLKKADRNRIESFFDQADWDVFNEITRSRCDVLWIHSYSFLTIWFGIVAAKIREIPLMIREEQTLLHQRPWWKAPVRWLVLNALFRGSTGLSIGSNNRAFFRRYGMPDQRIHLVAYTTDNNEWQRLAARLRPDRTSIRASFGIKNDSPVILFVGKLILKKQPDLLLEAFREVRRVHPCTLLIVGSGVLEEQMRRTVAEASVPDVIFAGFLNRSEIARAYAAADIFVLPSSLNETWGMVVNEAMNFALPIVVSDKVGCAADLANNDENGFIFDHLSVPALAQRLARLVGDSELRTRFGRRSLERITQWSPEYAAQGLVAAALAAVEGNHRSTGLRAPAERNPTA